MCTVLTSLCDVCSVSTAAAAFCTCKCPYNACKSQLRSADVNFGTLHLYCVDKLPTRWHRKQYVDFMACFHRRYCTIINTVRFGEIFGRHLQACFLQNSKLSLIMIMYTAIKTRLVNATQSNSSLQNIAMQISLSTKYAKYIISQHRCLVTVFTPSVYIVVCGLLF